MTDDAEVEKVARIIYDSLDTHGMAMHTWDLAGSGSKAFAYDAARAAIAALAPAQGEGANPLDDDEVVERAAEEVRRVRAMWSREPDASKVKCMDRAIAKAVQASLLASLAPSRPGPVAGAEALIEAVRAEPELPGPIPDEVIVELGGDPEGVLRATVRTTKKNIEARIRAHLARRAEGVKAALEQPGAGGEAREKFTLAAIALGYIDMRLIPEAKICAALRFNEALTALFDPRNQASASRGGEGAARPPT